MLRLSARGRGARRPGRSAMLLVVSIGLGVSVVIGPGMGVGVGGARALAQQQQEQAVLRGAQYLKTRAAGRTAGESAMMALALLKAEVPHGDPALQTCLARFRQRFNSSAYVPELGQGGHAAYEIAAVAMALANLDAVANRGYLQITTSLLLSLQNANGSWDYMGRTFGDTSITQYAVLGLWEAENAGIDVSGATWDRIASWFLTNQHSGGAWVYHNDATGSPETLSMTAAGVGSLLICKAQLERYRHDGDGVSKLLKTISARPESEFQPSNSNAQIDQAVKRGMAWISGHFAPDNATVTGPSPFYMLYGVERIGALAGRASIGRLPWYQRGRAFIDSNQQGDGSWQGMHGTEMNTVWAMLFLTRSTAKSIQRIKIQRLGAGTLLGGRGLPTDLSSMTVAGGRVVSRPMNGAIEEMLSVLEDPRAEEGDAAVAGLVDRYYRKGPDALRPFKPRFRKMLHDRDPGVRRVAAWALAHTSDMDVAPALINALIDPDEDVVASARLGLQVLSRKIDGLGPPSPSTPEQRRAAAERWRAWFNAIRPLDLGPDEEPIAPSQPPKPETAPKAPADGASPKSASEGPRP